MTLFLGVPAYVPGSSQSTEVTSPESLDFAVTFR